MKHLLKAATIVDPSNKALHLKKRDILIVEGRIEKIASRIQQPKDCKVIERKNLHVSLGWVDSSVSFGEPGYEERETINNGLKVAASSGFSQIVLNPNTHPVPDSSGAIIFLKNAAAGKSTALHPMGALTKESAGNELAELFDMNKSGAVCFYDYKAPVSNANLLKIALLYSQSFDGLVMSFPFDRDIAAKGQVNEGEVSTRLGLNGIPHLAEELQVARDLFILEYTGGKLHIPTISTAGSVKLIAAAKKKGHDVTCSTAVHNIWHTDEILEHFDSNYKVLPPLRTKADKKALIKGLQDGVIDLVTSDHTPIDIEEKRVEFEHANFGTIGLESSFGILNKIFGLETTIGLLTKGRERFGIPTASWEEGSRADLTLFDPEDHYKFRDSNIYSSSKNSLFLGEEMHGRVYGIIANGIIDL